MAAWGRHAYEAYVESCGGTAFNGDKLPAWEDQFPEIRKHWEAAGDAVYSAVMGHPRPHSVPGRHEPEVPQ